MSWITPLGLLGLLGIAVLILIYLLKPNYQQKIISSTHVWRLSLKYRKKKIPINRFRNILIFLCQVLIITACAFILTQPFIASEDNSPSNEKIVVIDASVSMRTESAGVTRFERAVEEVVFLAEETYNAEGIFSVILAGKEASFLAQRAGADQRDKVISDLSALVDSNGIQCTYGAADMAGAVSLAQNVYAENPKAEVLLYTGTRYLPGSGNGTMPVKIMDVSESTEWNASILSANASIEENYYTFTVEISCSDMSNTRAEEIMVYCDVFGANLERREVNMRMPVYCDGQGTQTAVFTAESGDVPVYSYDYVYVHIDEKDSFGYDNQYYLYGGEKPSIKVQYASTLSNNFYSGVLMGLRDVLRERWAIEIDEVRDDDEPALMGYDFYIFEHKMPEVLPTDGVVLIANPDRASEGMDIVLDGPREGDFTLAGGEGNPITSSLVSSAEITVTQYQRITAHDNYDEVLYCNGDPVFLLKNTPQKKVAIIAFSLNRSNLSMLLDFPVLMYRLFEYYLPSTIREHVFEIDETVELNARSTLLEVQGPGTKESYEVFPAQMSLSVPGIYTLSQTLMSGADVIENFYVKVPNSECDLGREVELDNTYAAESENKSDYDLILYLAAALVALLFAEWWLQSRENF